MCSFSGVLLTFYVGRGCAFFAFDFQEKRASVKWRKPVNEWERRNIGICQVAFSNTNLTTGWKDEWDVYSPGRGAKCLWIMAILLMKCTTCVPLGIVKHRHMKLHFFVNDLKCTIWNRKVNSWRYSEDIKDVMRWPAFDECASCQRERQDDTVYSGDGMTAGTVRWRKQIDKDAVCMNSRWFKYD